MFRGSFCLSCGDAAGISRGGTPNALYLTKEKRESNSHRPITPKPPEWLHVNAAINCWKEAPTYHLETLISGPR